MLICFEGVLDRCGDQKQLQRQQGRKQQSAFGEDLCQ